MKTILQILHNLFGSEWSTWLWGGFTLFCAGLIAQPEMFKEVLPEAWVTYMAGWAKIIIYFTSGSFIASVKPANVTGGTDSNPRGRDPETEQNADRENVV